MTSRILRSLAAALVAAASVASAAAAIEDPTPPARPNAKRESPRAAVRGYLMAARAADFVAAAAYLDLSELSGEEREEQGPILARELQVVLDQKLWIDFEKLSDRLEGDPNDGLPADRDRIGTIESRRGSFDVNVTRSADEDGTLVWRFSPGTIDRLAILNDEFGLGPLAARVPNWSIRWRFLEMEAWQWFGLIIAGAMAFVVARLVVRPLYHLARRQTPRTEPEFREPILGALLVPVRQVIALTVFVLGARLLRLSAPSRYVLVRIVVACAIIVVMSALMALADLFATRIVARMSREGRRSGMATVVLLRRVVKGFIVALAIVAGLQTFGFNVTGILAGLGIGGIAIALAGQKTIENLFGSIVLSVDQPIRIGDTCRFGTSVGVVEDIGLRSTRIRTIDRSIVTVPNAELSTIQIENLSMRDQIRILATIGLRYETTPAQLRSVLEAIRALLAGDSRIAQEGMRVRFVGFGAYSLDIEMMAYVRTEDFNEFLAVREDIYLKVMDVVAESGTSFAFPSQTLYMARDERVAPEPARPLP